MTANTAGHHRGVVKKPRQLMFITPGAGTEHRPV
jgi:hypothetical protein